MSSAQPILTVPLSPENEAATAQLESMAHVLGEGVRPIESYRSANKAALARASDFFKKQGEKLVALAAEHHAILPSEVFQHIKPLSNNTAEVIVYPQKDRVYKSTYVYDRHTQFNFFGYTLFCGDYRSRWPYFSQMEAAPSEYLERLALANRVFGSDNRFEGVTIDEKGKPHIVTSQHYFNSLTNRVVEWVERVGCLVPGLDLIKEHQVNRFMAQKGFRTLDYHRCWYRPLDGIIVEDAHLGNFKHTKNGKIAPIDLMLIQVNAEKLKESGWDMDMPKGYKPPAQTPVPIPELAPEPPRFPPLIAGLKRLHLVPKETAKKQVLDKER